MAVNQIKAGAILNYVNIALNAILGLLYTPYMLGMLGKNEYGLYSLVASVISYLTLFDFGFGSAVVRYTAKFRAERKEKEQWEMFGMFFVVYLVLGALAFGTGLALYFNVDAMFDQTMTQAELNQASIMMLLLVVNVAVTFPLSMFGSIITAYEDFVFQRVLTMARLLLSTAVIVLVLFLGYKAVAMVVVQTVFNIAYLLINYFYARYKIRIKIWFANFNWSLIKEISIYSFWQFLNGIMDKIYWSTGQFVLGSLVGTAAVAVFSVAITLESMYMSFSTAIANLLLPRITAMVARNSSDKEISDVFVRTGRIQCIVMALILSGFIVFGQAFIDLWAGPEYAQSYIISLIFFVALFIPLIQNTGITILQARNQMKFRCLLYVVIAFASLAGQILLARTFGGIGVAAAIGVGLLLGQGVVINIYYAVRQRLEIMRFWREIGKMVLLPAVLTVMFACISRHVDLQSWGQLGIAILVFLVVYAPAFWFLSMNSYERQLIGEPIRRTCSKIFSHA